MQGPHANMPRSHGRFTCKYASWQMQSSLSRSPTVTVSPPAGPSQNQTAPDSDVLEALEAASVSLTHSATVLVICPDSRGVKKQVLLLLGAADGGGLGGWSGPGWSAARAVVESEAGPMI